MVNIFLQKILKKVLTLHLKYGIISFVDYSIYFAGVVQW